MLHCSCDSFNFMRLAHAPSEVVEIHFVQAHDYHVQDGDFGVWATHHNRVHLLYADCLTRRCAHRRSASLLLFAECTLRPGFVRHRFRTPQCPPWRLLHAVNSGCGPQATSTPASLQDTVQHALRRKCTTLQYGTECCTSKVHHTTILYSMLYIECAQRYIAVVLPYAHCPAVRNATTPQYPQYSLARTAAFGLTQHSRAFQACSVQLYS